MHLAPVSDDPRKVGLHFIQHAFFDDYAVVKDLIFPRPPDPIAALLGQIVVLPPVDFLRVSVALDRSALTTIDFAARGTGMPNLAKY